MGLSLSVFANRPPCACALPEAAASTPACPHCAKVETESPTANKCCQGKHGVETDCECPCCDSSPADQPLVLSAATVVLPVGADLALFVDTADYSLPALQASFATRGWRERQLVLHEAPRLERLCRWII
jgi:hypothetical protein